MMRAIIFQFVANLDLSLVARRDASASESQQRHGQSSAETYAEMSSRVREGERKNELRERINSSVE